MAFFDNLLTTPWSPGWSHVADAEEAADRTNLPHEDYPARVQDTLDVLLDSTVSWPPTREELLAMHRRIFYDQPFGGRFRQVNVRVGLHRPPDHRAVPGLMEDLYAGYLGTDPTLDNIIDWYIDIKTIHPFQDGNGRVGGAAVYLLARDNPGIMMAPNQ